MRYLLGLLIGSIFWLSSCNQNQRIEIPFQTFVTIPAGLSVGFSHNFRIRDIVGINNPELLEAQPAYVTLTLDYGENSVDFIEKAFFYTLDDTGIQEIAYQPQLPINNARSAQLYPSILNARDHINQPLFDMEIKLIFRSIPVTETRLRIDFGFQGTLED